MKSPLSFQHYLLISILTLSGIPTLILGAYHFQDAFQSTQERFTQADLRQSQAFARELKAQLETRIEVVKALAASAVDPLSALLPLTQDVWRSSERLKIDQLQHLVDGIRARSSYFDFMYIARLRGESIAISPLRSPQGRLYVGSNYRDRDYFKQLLKTQRVAISQVQLGKRSQKPNIQIVAPIFKAHTSSQNAELIGLSEGSVNLEMILNSSQQKFGSQRLRTTSLEPEETRLLVLDHRDQVLIDTNEPHSILTHYHPLVERSPEGIINDRGKRWQVNGATLSVEGGLTWRVFVLRDVASLHHHALSDAINALIPSIILTLIILIAALLFSRRLAHDVGRLRDQFQEIARGHDESGISATEPYLNIREWAQLFQATQELSATLREHRKQERERQEILKINERLSSLSSLAAGVTHEINNPLMYILAHLDFVIEGLERGESAPLAIREMITLLQQSKEGAEQVREVAASLQHIGHRNQKPSWHQLSESITQALRLANIEIKHQSELRVEIHSEGFFHGSDVKLSQVLIQLIKNGLYAMQMTKSERPPLLEVIVSEHQALTSRAQLIGMIEVIDNGSGIPEEIESRLFEPFFTTKPRAIGTGLGLAICQQIIHDMGGSISFTSEPQRGTRFRIEIPLISTLPEGVTLRTLTPAPDSTPDSTLDVTPQERQHLSPPPSPPPSPSPRQPLSDSEPLQNSPQKLDKPNVLVVDDVEAITTLIQRQLKRRYNVLSVNSAQDALKILSEQSFDVILSDVMMPHMSGVELYIHAITQWPEVSARFVFMTGGVLDERDQKFFIERSVTCLNKPCQRATLIHEIESCLHSQAS